MSGPISNSDSFVFQAESRDDFEYHEVDEATALAAPNHRVCFRLDGEDVEHHVFARGRRLRHDYFGHRPPADALRSAHRAEWPGVPFDLIERSDTTETRYQHDEAGEYVLRTVYEHVANQTTSQTAFAPDGAFVERQEYEYDEDGDLCLTRVLAEDGTVLTEEAS